MQYYCTTLGTNLPPPDWRMKLIYTLLWFIPRSNPDFEAHVSQIRRWYVEVDEAGRPSREIGIDESGMPITAAPWQSNFGFWTDSAEPLPAERTEEIAEDVFLNMWQRFEDLQANRSQASNVA